MQSTHWIQLCLRELDGGELNITIYKGENAYELSVVGNREPSIHSAIEYKNGEVHSYLKLTPIYQ
ncbi:MULTISPECIES: hypothetical protein [Vibrio]|jgi:hypothetical protein|uniref:hypothetical protein n=1 Tax=Vibrio TaxID=662 RepID=UPI000E680D5E|nr:hypothetical protein [Vibrio sp. PID23_8]